MTVEGLVIVLVEVVVVVVVVEVVVLVVVVEITGSEIYRK